MLSETSSKVYAIPGKKGYIEDFPELKHLRRNPKVVFKEGVSIKEIGGTDFVEYVELDNGEDLTLDGVFIILEHVSTSGILEDAGVTTDDGGCILSDKEQKTTVSGVFAAGDCCCKGLQIVTATGMGAMAGLNAMKYVKELSRR